jgi:hypothetical protein
MSSIPDFLDSGSKNLANGRTDEKTENQRNEQTE